MNRGSAIKAASFASSMQALRDYVNHRVWEAEVRKRIAPAAYQLEPKTLRQRLFARQKRSRLKRSSDEEYRKSFWTEVPLPIAIVFICFFAVFCVDFITGWFCAIFVTTVEERAERMERKRQAAEHASSTTREIGMDGRPVKSVG